MSEDQAFRLLWGVGALMLVGSSLLARRLPLGQSIRMALAWLAIFAAAFGVFALRHDIAALWSRIVAADRPARPVSNGGEVRVRRGDDGHFAIEARVNDRPVRFVVDTGATTTTLNPQDAKRAGIAVDDGGFPVVLDTANGITTARRARIATLTIGDIRRQDVAALVGEGLGDINLLGMNYLNALSGWRVEGDMLVLTP